MDGVSLRWDGRLTPANAGVFFMHNEHPALQLNTELTETVISDEYPFECSDITINTAVSYEGKIFNIAVAFSTEGEENFEMGDITTLGWRHANLVACSLLALLEAYGQPHLMNDKDIQEDFASMVQEAKDAYAQKAFEQIRSRLEDE